MIIGRPTPEPTPEQIAERAKIEADRSFIFDAREGGAVRIYASLAAGARPSNARALRAAAQGGQFECAMALAPYCDVTETDERGVDALRLALSREKLPLGVPLVRQLLEAGAQPGALDTLGRDALGWAVGGGNLEAFLIVLPFCDPLLTASDCGLTPLMMAALGGFPDYVSLLLPLSDLNAVSADGERLDELAIAPAIAAQIQAYRTSQRDKAALEDALPASLASRPHLRV